MKTTLNAILCSLVAFFVPIQGVLLLVGFAIFLDTFFGIYAAYKRGEKIRSKIMGWGFVSKQVAYCFVILFVYALEILLLEDILHHILSIHLVATKISAIVLISIEAYSIDENIRSFNNGKGAGFYFTRLINLGKSVKKMSNDFKKES